MGNIYLFYYNKTMKFFALATLAAVASAVTLRDEVDHSGEFFQARDNGTGPLDKKYERDPPAQPADASDDLFMRSMIMNYAREGKNADGSPNGVFTMTEAQTRGASAEVKEYLNTYFPRTWAHFDVNKVGAVGVETLPQFVRFLASDQQLSL